MTDLRVLQVGKRWYKCGESARFWQTVRMWVHEKCPKRLSTTGVNPEGEEVAIRNGKIDVPLRRLRKTLYDDCIIKMAYRPGSVIGGNWDLHTYDLVGKVGGGDHKKFNAVKERLIDGKRWRETELFQEVYRPRLERGEVVRGCRSLSELESRYSVDYEPLAESLARGQQPRCPVWVHIDRFGNCVFGYDGNHRLFIAMALGLTSITGRVWGMHELAKLSFRSTDKGVPLSNC